MIGKQQIEDTVKEFMKGTGLFIVAVKVSSSNRITVFVDKNEGISIDECAAIHRHIEMNIDRDKEDYELQVSSPGLDLPFVVPEQYYKNEGNVVEVIDYDGNKYNGKLRNVTSGGFELESEFKVKGKSKEIREISFNFDQVKSTRIFLTI